MGSSPRHLASHARGDRRRRRFVGVSIATVILVIAAAVTVVAIRRHDSTGTTVAARGSGRSGPGSAGSPTAGRSPTTGLAPGRSSSPDGSTNGSTTTVAPTTTIPATTTTTVPGGVLGGPAVAQYVAARGGQVTAAVYDVTTGTMSLLNPGVAEDTASIVKVDILATLLHTAQAAGTDPDADGDGDVAGLNDEQQELATTMIEDSDNDSATSLWDEDGSAAGIAAFDGLIPLTDTTPGADGYWGLTTTTAADQVALVKRVALSNSLLDATSRAYELNLMENVEPYDYWGVSSGPTDGATVALKNGWLPLTGDDWQCNSIGWIDGDGRDYVIAVLTDGSPTEAYGIDTIEGLSTMVWDGLGT